MLTVICMVFSNFAEKSTGEKQRGS